MPHPISYRWLKYKIDHYLRNLQLKYSLFVFLYNNILIDGYYIIF